MSAAKPFRHAWLLSLACLFPSLLAAQESAIVLDSIVAIVEEDIVTSRELENRINLIRSDFKKANRQLPEESRLREQVLEVLVNSSLLLQEANRRGIRVSDSQLNQTMQNIAKQNKMRLSDYRLSLISEGLDYEKFRESVRTDIAVSTLNRQYSQRNASVSELEVDDFIALSGTTDNEYEYRLSHILLSLPDAAAPEQIAKARETAAEIIEKLEQGIAFDQLANSFSASDTALQGGDLGWRKKAQIPALFTDQTITMNPGDFAGPIRSASGFHIISLQDRRNLQQVLTRQTKSRHILIKPNALISEDEARNRLVEFRKRIESGEDFSRLAKLYSVDYVSGSDGGDLGWTDPGSMVREFENMTDQLEKGEISMPFRTQFGWHIVQLTGRRTLDETAENRRNKIRQQLLQQKQQEVFDLWKRKLRDEAFVSYPDA